MSWKCRICGAGFPTCGFTGLYGPVFQKNWRLESRLNPQTRMSAPHLNACALTQGGFRWGGIAVGCILAALQAA